MILIIYCDSAAFVFATAIVVHGFGINSSPQVCEGGILLCRFSQDCVAFGLLTSVGLICYMTTKILIYYFLVEKAVSNSQVTVREQPLTSRSMSFVEA